MSRDTRRQLKAVTDAGGTYRQSGNHFMFYDANGRLIGKSRMSGTKQGRAARQITEAMAKAAQAAAPVTPPAARPSHPQPTWEQLPLPAAATVAESPAPASPSSTKEGRPVEKKILVCDACEADGRFAGAHDSVTITSTLTGKRRKLDLCREHIDALFQHGAVVQLRGSAKAEKPAAPKVRKYEANMRCPLPGDDGYEGSGQGMFQHVKNHHPDIEWGDGLKEAARAAFQLAHTNGQRVAAAV